MVRFKSHFKKIICWNRWGLWLCDSGNYWQPPFPCVGLICSTRDVIGRLFRECVMWLSDKPSHWRRTPSWPSLFLLAYLLLAQTTNKMNVGLSFSVSKWKVMCCCFYCFFAMLLFYFCFFLGKKKMWHLFGFKMNRIQSGFLCWNATVVWRLVNRSP